jgi:putative sterol carrier protein
VSDRARPPDDIEPHEFFTRWVVEAVNQDEDRRMRLGETDAVIVFELTGDGGGWFTVSIAGGTVSGAVGAPEHADLRVAVDVQTWRALNRGEVSAPEALLRRRVKLSGSFLLGLKLHLILG